MAHEPTLVGVVAADGILDACRAQWLRLRIQNCPEPPDDILLQELKGVIQMSIDCSAERSSNG